MKTLNCRWAGAHPRSRLLVVAVVVLGMALGWGWLRYRAGPPGSIALRSGLSPNDRMTVHLEQITLAQACWMYGELTGRNLLPRTNNVWERLDDFFGQAFSRRHLLKRTQPPSSGIEYHRDGLFSALEVKEKLESLFQARGLQPVPEGTKCFRIVPAPPSGG